MRPGGLCLELGRDKRMVEAWRDGEERRTDNK
jgi:hypothetical protein